MRTKTVRYTATLPETVVEELKEMTEKKTVPSVNYAIIEALEVYLKNRRRAEYEALMEEAGRDPEFLARTLTCQEDFRVVDSEIMGTW